MTFLSGIWEPFRAFAAYFEWRAKRFNLDILESKEALEDEIQDLLDGGTSAGLLRAGVLQQRAKARAELLSSLRASSDHPAT